jgi:hypothetical protein
MVKGLSISICLIHDHLQQVLILNSKDYFKIKKESIMNKNKILSLFLGVFLLVGLSSCEDYFGDINVNPNSPVDVPAQVLLPSIQVQLGYTLGGDFSRFSSILMQHCEGVARQWTSINDYGGFNPSAFNTVWSENIYAGILIDLKTLKEKTEADSYDQYTGVANTLLAYTWMSATDVWGDLPYTEAFEGTVILTPKFDSQEFIYGEIFKLLDAADTQLAGTDGGLAVGSEDLMFGGTIENWQTFAKAVRAKASLHLAEVDPAKYYADALSAAGQAMTSSAGNAVLPFGAGPTESAPWYQFNRDRTGDIQIGTKMDEITIALGDPRGDLYRPDFKDFDEHPTLVAAQNWPFATYTEMKFIEAEALMMTNGGAADIHAAFIEAITADFAELGVDGTAYIATIDPGEGNVTLEDIMTQKYIALFMEPELLNDWRRTGIPNLTPNSGQFVPIRFPYAETEILRNPDNTPTINIFTDKVWWDR